MRAYSAATASPYAHAQRRYDDNDGDGEYYQDNSFGYHYHPTTNTAMGASAAGLQIWPKVLPPSPHQESPVDLEAPRYNRAPSDSISSHAGSYSDTPTRRRPILHAAASQPDLPSSYNDHSIRTDSTIPPPIPQAHRGQKLDFAKIFSRSKNKHKTKGLPSHTVSSELLPLPRPINADGFALPSSDTVSARPGSSSTASHRTQATTATVFDRNPTENAKINVRRPPKGIKYWFEGLDESDDDLPEVVSPAGPISTDTFRPSLGPGRSRVAPTSRVSPACEPPSGDYFHFSSASQHQNLQDCSMLNLSSDEDDDGQSEPPSPAIWRAASNDNSDPTSSADSRSSWTKAKNTRQSTFSVQTTMTSGSIPIIHAEGLEMAYRTPLPPLPAQYRTSIDHSAVVPAPLRKQKSYNLSSASGRSRAKSSATMASTASAASSTKGQSHVMAVTHEEMALLEMMRRKRAEMHAQPPTATHPASRRVSPFERNHSIARSTASSHMSHGSSRSLGIILDSPDGHAFPAPPSARVVSESENSNYFTTDRKFKTPERNNYNNNNGNTRKNQRKNSEISTPHSTYLAELEAPTDQLSSLCFTASDLETYPPSKTVPFHNTADPFSLAPDLELSSLDLLPLPARTYSPSLAGTCSSAMTPEFSNHIMGFGLAGSENGSDGDRPRTSMKSVDSVDIDVFAAWNRLGGA